MVCDTARATRVRAVASLRVIFKARARTSVRLRIRVRVRGRVRVWVGESQWQ